MTKLLCLLALAIVSAPQLASANVAGGGTGQGPDVTVVDHHDGTVTLANGIVSIVIDTKKARLDRVTYTHKNSGQRTHQRRAAAGRERTRPILLRRVLARQRRVRVRAGDRPGHQRRRLCRREAAQRQ